jgi:hypothetical protein
MRDSIESWGCRVHTCGLVLGGIGGSREVCVSDGVSKVHRDELHGLLQFQGGNAK